MLLHTQISARLRPAFTIIELLVATTLIALLAAYAAPRLTAYLRERELLVGVQDIAACIESGRELALSPKDTGYSHIAVTLRMFSSGGRFLECEYARAAGYTTENNVPPTVGNATKYAAVPPITLCAVDVSWPNGGSGSLGELSGSGAYQLLFSVERRGAPVAVFSAQPALPAASARTSSPELVLSFIRSDEQCSDQAAQRARILVSPTGATRAEVVTL